MIEFISFGMVVGIPVGIVGFLLARWKGRSRRAWGLSMWCLAALWLAGAAALPSMASGERVAALFVVFIAAGCLLAQAVLFLWLLVAAKPGAEAGPASGKRIVILLAIMGVLLALSLVFGFVL